MFMQKQQLMTRKTLTLDVRGVRYAVIKAFLLPCESQKQDTVIQGEMKKNTDSLSNVMMSKTAFNFYF